MYTVQEPFTCSESHWDGQSHLVRRERCTPELPNGKGIANLQEKTQGSQQSVGAGELQAQLAQAQELLCKARQAEATAQADTASLSLRYTAAEERASVAEAQAQVCCQPPCSQCKLLSVSIRRSTLPAEVVDLDR